MNIRLRAESDDKYLGDISDALKLQDRDPVRVFQELLRLAQNGSINSMLELGWAYKKGLGTKTDTDEAARWFRRAYDGGATQAALYLGGIYWRMEKYADARDIFAKGGEDGDPVCLYWLGRMYQDGIAVEKAPDKAYDLYVQASAGGSLIARAAAARLLMSGRCGASRILVGVYQYVITMFSALVSCFRKETNHSLRH
ncbi:MAG: hypothetical protein U1F34_00190 [Gammaproteobacteria bacterium]